MNNCCRWLRLAVGAFLVSGLLIGCGVGPSEPARYYVLSSSPELSTAASPSTPGKRLTIGIGPVQLPAHLDRTQIVMLTSRHRLDLKDLDQWAEPLKDGFTRILVKNLSALLPTDRFFEFPWRRPIVVDYQVSIQVVQFDTNAQGESVLSARWNIIKGDGRELLYSQTSTFAVQAAGQDVEQVVEVMSENLGQFSREISTSIAAFSR